MSFKININEIRLTKTILVSTFTSGLGWITPQSYCQHCCHFVANSCVICTKDPFPLLCVTTLAWLLSPFLPFFKATVFASIFSSAVFHCFACLVWKVIRSVGIGRFPCHCWCRYQNRMILLSKVEIFQLYTPSPVPLFCSCRAPVWRVFLSPES